MYNVQCANCGRRETISIDAYNRRFREARGYERREVAERIRNEIRRLINEPNTTRDEIIDDLTDELLRNYPRARQEQIRRYIEGLYGEVESRRGIEERREARAGRADFRFRIRRRGAAFLRLHGYTPDADGMRQFRREHPNANDPLRIELKEALRERRPELRSRFLGEGPDTRRLREERIQRILEDRASRRVVREREEKESGITELRERRAGNLWGRMPALSTPHSSSGRIIATAAWAVIGLIFAAIIGNALFVFAFLCWALHQILPGPRDVRGIDRHIRDRIERTRRQYEQRLRAVRTEEERANIIREREVALREAEMIYAADLEELRMGWSIGGSTILKELFKVAGWLLFALSFALSSVPFAKPIGIILMFVAYFAVGYNKTRTPEGDEETERRITRRLFRNRGP